MKLKKLGNCYHLTMEGANSFNGKKKPDLAWFSTAIQIRPMPGTLESSNRYVDHIVKPLKGKK